MNKSISIIIIASIMLLASCAQQQNTPITIGALFPLTGGLSQYGEAAQKAAMVAVDEINAAGGINGRQLQIDYQDHQCDPKTAVTLFTQLSEAKQITLFTSAACSGTVLAIAPLLESKNALLLGTIITAPKITNSSQFVFRNWAIDQKQAKLYAAEAKKRGLNTIGVIHEETDYAQGLKISLEQALSRSSIKILSESFPTGTTDVRTQLTKLKQINPDAIFVSPQTVTSADMILKQMRELNMHPQLLFVNDNVLKATALVQQYKDLLEGAISADYIMQQTPALTAMLEHYKQKHGTACPQTNICAGVYDAIHLLAQAITEEGENAKGVQQFLKTITYKGVSGTISFDQNNDRNNAEYTLHVIKNGVGVPLAAAS